MEGKSTILFNKKKWVGVYPKKIKGICATCGKQIEVTEKEYRDLMKEGELN